MRPPSLASLARRVARLESERDQPQDKIDVVKAYIEFCFDKARWDITAPTAIFDQEARREQLGALHALVTIWEKLGEETPNDIGDMVFALAKRDKPFQETQGEVK